LIRHGPSVAAGPQCRRLTVTDDALLSPYVYDGLDPPRESRPTPWVLSAVLKDAIGLVGCALDTARKPGMPLGILSSVTREAPLGSLLVAFLLGVTFARRRMR
jgi:hypothetical protein